MKKPRPWTRPLAVGLLTFPLIVGTVLFSDYRDSRLRLINSARIWDMDLARALATQDLATLRQIGKGLYSDSFKLVRITTGRGVPETLVSFPLEGATDACFGEIRLPVAHYGSELGTISACPRFESALIHYFTSPLSILVSLLIVALLLSIGLVPLLRYRRNLRTFLQALQAWSRVPDTAQPASLHDAQDPIFSELYALVEEGTKRRLDAKRWEAEAITARRLRELASQVAHDIRSPVAAVQSVAFTAGAIESEQRALLKQAAERIQSIADEVLRDHREERNPRQPTLVVAIVEKIIAEKQAASVGRLPRPEIQFGVGMNPLHAIANVDPVGLGRVVSNLLNNSIEACARRIEVSLRERETVPRSEASAARFALVIEDDGIGIPAEIQASLGRRGFSHHKAEGSGLGLSHAFDAVAAWQGSIAVQSPSLGEKAGRGTRVVIELPQVEPRFYCDAIALSAVRTVAILDDDPTVHGAWQSRLAAAPVEIRTFTRAADFSAFVEDVRARPGFDPGGLLCLCDYELPNQGTTGLGIIRELSLQDSAMLVTSRYDHPRLIDACAAVGVRLLPKPWIQWVPLH